MKPLSASGLPLFHLGILRAASFLTPGPQRAEWWREWYAELWHMRKTCAPQGIVSSCAQREMTAFCLGAFQDALCLRRHSWKKPPPLLAFRGSATQCVVGLALLLAVSWFLAEMLPGVRIERHPAHYQLDSGLILIQKAAGTDDSAPTVTAEQFRAWKARRQRYFEAFAFYRMAAETVPHAHASLQVAYASPDLFALLGVPLRFAESPPATPSPLPSVILSEEAWRRHFGANPRLIGSPIQLGSRQARVAGVAPEGAWRLPGKPDAWFLQSNTEAAGVGYVLARLTRLGRSEMTGFSVPIAVLNTDDTDEVLAGVSLKDRTRGPWELYLFTVFLALVALPAITSVSMGEYGFNAHRLPWPKKLARWGFLAAKIALLLPIAYFVSLDLAYWHSTFFSTAAEYVQLASSFAICLFGMRWVLLDQRKRCPVCLHCVTHPAQVGQASRTFLAWNGTEMMCMGGHTLLHVPSLPTSWFGAPRWLYLDTSWDFLFAGSGVG